MAMGGVRKRQADDGAGAETGVASLVVKRARFEMEEGDCLQSLHSSPEETATPLSTKSLASTEMQSLAETSMTSRSSSKRPKKYLCGYAGCTKAFDRPVRLQAHLRTHTDERPFVCEERACTKSFFKAEHLKAHIQNKHSDEANFVCSYVVSTDEQGEPRECGKAFTTATRLRRHLAAHEEKEDLKCHEPGCGQVFRKLETLQRHIKKEHLGERPFRCAKPVTFPLSSTDEECGQSFSTISQLKSHEIKEHLGLKYFCETCSPPDSSECTSTEPVGFHTYTEYQSHLKTVHPPTCTICNTACASNRALAAHMEIEHSTLASRQKFFCEYYGCGRGFTRKGNLNVHVQNVHVKNKKYTCGAFDLSESEKCPGWDGQVHHCGLSFGTKANLEEHVRTQHLGLQSLYHPLKSEAKAKKIKQEDTDTNTPSATKSSMMDLDEPPQTSTLTLLTGHGYADSRPLPCWDDTCPVRFTRQYDLAQHMELTHAWNVDDINDVLAEQAALKGEKFWIGGAESQDMNGGEALGVQFQQGLSLGPPVEGFAGGEVGQHAMGQHAMGQHAMGQHAMGGFVMDDAFGIVDNALIDPALVAM